MPIEFIGAYVNYTSSSLLGYIPYLIISTLISLYIFKNTLKKSVFILISRIFGVIVSLGITQMFLNNYNASNYFKPFSTNEFMMFLGIINFVIIAIIYLVIYGFSSKNN